MKRTLIATNHAPRLRDALALMCGLGIAIAGHAQPGSIMPPARKPSPTPKTSATTKAPATATTKPKATAKSFDTPEQAAQALIAAADPFDEAALKAILGPDGAKLVTSEDHVQDKNQAEEFAEQARAHNRVARDSTNAKVARLLVGNDDWPLPIPIVQSGTKWHFDSKAGAHEVLLRRIGRNELDAIDVCRGFVEAEIDYASEKHDGSDVNQYAQKILSTPGKHDGLAWQGADGTWQGPVGEGIAKVIAEGYSDKLDPFHGYYFKILKGQGPAAPLGEMDFLVKGRMIGGFALVAAPADYEVTGIMTFIVSHEGIVYQKDLGKDTVAQFKAMERYNPDSTWKPVPNDDVNN